MSSFSGFDQEPSNVSELVDKMEAFENFLRDENRESFIPFLRAYRRITEKVQRQKNSFDNPSELEKLDLEFGKLYFDAMKAYFREGKKVMPWRNYLNYMERNDSRPLLELLLGINAHINADLAVLLDEMDYSEEEDFNRVNRILLESLYPVLIDTAHMRRDFEALTFLSSGPLPFYGLNKIICWRQKAWKERYRTQEEIKKQTEKKACDLISLRHDRSFTGILEKPFRIIEA